MGLHKEEDGVEESGEVPGTFFRKVIKDMKSSLNQLSEIILKLELFLLDFPFPYFANLTSFMLFLGSFQLRFLHLKLLLIFIVFSKFYQC